MELELLNDNLCECLPTFLNHKTRDKPISLPGLCSHSTRVTRMWPPTLPRRMPLHAPRFTDGHGWGLQFVDLTPVWFRAAKLSGWLGWIRPSVENHRMRTHDSEFMQIDGSNQAEGRSKVKERVYFPETGKSSSFTNMECWYTSTYACGRKYQVAGNAGNKISAKIYSPCIDKLVDGDGSGDWDVLGECSELGLRQRFVTGECAFARSRGSLGEAQGPVEYRNERNEQLRNVRFFQNLEVKLYPDLPVPRNASNGSRKSR